MIKVANLNFSYKKGVGILNNLSFEVPKGVIFGFLGANGSGKTTTIRILLGLCKAESGKIWIDGKPFYRSQYQQYQKIGAMIEEPSLYGHLSGYDNLRLLLNYYKVDKKRIDEVLETVGLTEAKHKKVRDYSLGMKQRLGIAQCLLHEPEILFLDEPLNGLDPSGIKEMRELLFQLRDAGKTIFLSSHQLSEVEKSCEHLCIIDKGTQVFEGTVSEMQSMLSKEVRYQIVCSDARAVQTVFTEANVDTELQDLNNLFITLGDKSLISQYIKQIAMTDIDLFEVKKSNSSLEDMFLKMTK